MSKRPGQERHDLIEDRLRLLEEAGAIEDWRYERPAQRYLVTLVDEVLLQGGVAGTNVLVMTMMAAEAFLAGVLVADRLKGRVFIVDQQGVVYVE